MLGDLAARMAESAPSVEAELLLATCDLSFAVGDIVEKIDGRNLELVAGLRKPSVTLVELDFVRQTTRLSLRE
jgi:hypothetical protein